MKRFATTVASDRNLESSFVGMAIGEPIAREQRLIRIMKILGVWSWRAMSR